MTAIAAGISAGMIDPWERAYQQLRYELFGDHGPQRGCFPATATAPFQQVSAWMTDVASPVRHHPRDKTSDL